MSINSSLNTMDDFSKRILSIPRVKKTFVYGAKDYDFDYIVPRLKELDCANLEIIILDGIDHEFTDRVDDFIALIDFI